MSKVTILLISLLALFSSCTHNERVKTLKSCTIAIEDEPSSFDPRLIRNTCSVNIIHLIGEGLFRFDEKGQLLPALAEKVVIDKTGKIYTFTLKNAYWSNGDKISALDFENTIKSLMSPSVPSPHANQLYVIRGAKAAKEGAPLEKIGVKALDDKTLVIELNEPTPYFLTLTATHFLYPVHKNDLELTHKTHPIASGPFMLESFIPSSEILLKKNDHFWDAGHVHLKSIKLLPLNDQIALQMFDSGEIDWVGSPIGRLPPDAIPKLMKNNQLHVQDALGTFWLRANTLDPALASKELRKALSLSIDRDEIITHITQGGQKPATTIVPPILYGETTLETIQPVYDQIKIQEPISLIYIHNERNHKMAQYLEQKWKEKLGIPLKLEAQESKTYYERVASGQFQLSLGAWIADIPDAVNFLDVFKYKETKTNGTGWENAEYIALLNQASKEQDPKARIALLKQSEEILMNDPPVIPLYFAIFNWVQNPQLHGVIVSPLGFFDFRGAQFDE